MTKLTRLLCIGLVVSVLMIGCSQAGNNELETTSPPQPTTTEKETELPEGTADLEKNTPVTTTPPKSPATPTTKALPPAVNTEPPPKAEPELPQSTLPRDREVPPVAPINKTDPNGAIAKTYKSPDISGTILPYLTVSKEQLGICQDEGFDPELSKNASEVYRVGDNTYLAKFLCTMSAYQPIQEYYLYERTNDAPIVATLPITYFYRDPNGKLIEQSERAIAGLADYDPSTQTVSIYTKGRGLGDCGSLGFYKFQGDELVVTRVLAKDECDGNYVEPANYPQIYP